MGHWRAVLLLALGMLAVAGCGGRADVPVATVPGGDSDFSARQTQIVQQGAATQAAQPTATRTATPEPSPTATALATTIIVSSTRAPAPTPTATVEPTPGSAVGVPPTATPAPTEPGMEFALITGCTAEPITVAMTSDELVANVEDWQAMGEASQAIFAAWEEFFALIEDFFLYNQVVNNTEVFDGAAEFQAVAEEHLPALEAVESDSPFYALAQTVVSTTRDQITVGQLLTRAGTEHDQTYWDEALALSATFAQQARDFDTEFDLACDYWEFQQP